MSGDNIRLVMVITHLFFVTLLGDPSRTDGTIMNLREEYVRENTSIADHALKTTIPIIIGINSVWMYI